MLIKERLYIGIQLVDSSNNMTEQHQFRSKFNDRPCEQHHKKIAIVSQYKCSFASTISEHDKNIIY